MFRAEGSSYGKLQRLLIGQKKDKTSGCPPHVSHRSNVKQKMSKPFHKPLHSKSLRARRPRSSLERHKRDYECLRLACGSTRHALRGTTSLFTSLSVRDEASKTAGPIQYTVPASVTASALPEGRAAGIGTSIILTLESEKYRASLQYLIMNS